MAKVTSNQYVKVVWIPDALMTAAQAKAPSTTLLNNTSVAQDLSPAIAWQDFSLASDASDTVEDRGITDAGNAQSRGFSNFSGTLAFFRDITQGNGVADATSDYVKAFATFRTPRTYGYLVLRIAEKKWNAPFAAGDHVSVYKMIADIITDDATGDDSVKFSVSFLPQGIMYPYTVVQNATPDAITGVPATKSAAAGSKDVLLPLLSGTDVRQLAVYTTSDATKVQVSANGVVTNVAAGTANITVQVPGATAPVVQARTVT